MTAIDHALHDLGLREMEARAGALANMGDRALAAIVLTDGFGRIAEANRVARAILAERDGVMNSRRDAARSARKGLLEARPADP